MMRRLGRRWQPLHRLVYPAAALAVLHYFWKAKADTSEPLIFATILRRAAGHSSDRAGACALAQR
jgi:methionine sulfoxide reductase heme-binding subunit